MNEHRAAIMMYNVTNKLQNAINATPGAIRAIGEKAKAAAVGNKDVLTEALPITANVLTGRINTDRIVTEELRIAELKRKRKPYWESVAVPTKLPAEVVAQHEKISRYSNAISRVAQVLFPLSFEEDYMARQTRIDRTNYPNIPVDPEQAHMAEHSITRGVKMLADVGARVVPIAGVAFGDVNPFGALLVSEAMAAGNTFVANFVYGWRRRLLEESRKPKQPTWLKTK